MSLIHFLLQRSAVDRVVKPVRDQAALRRWMAAGRPVPPPHAAKVAAVWVMADMHGLDVLVETGTHHGKMIRALAPRFKRIYSIELSHELAKSAAREFNSHPHVNIIEGDSGICLLPLVRQLTEPSMFWLDAHYCGRDSIRGSYETPIVQEIDAIIQEAPKGSMLMIDDARQFTGSEYPLLEEFMQSISERTGYPVMLFNDIIAAKV